MPPPQIMDPSKLDLTNIVADLDEIRRHNPQRFEMELLTAIVLLDESTFTIAGYKDLTHDEFWVRGHMPGYPLMPGVLMCETAAQLCSYYLMKCRTFDSDFIGLGGLDEVSFRAPVRPGKRLIMIAQLIKARKFIATCRAQAFVDNQMVFNAIVAGVPLKKGVGPR